MHKNKQTVNDLQIQILQNMLLIYLIQKQNKNRNPNFNFNRNIDTALLRQASKYLILFLKVEF